MKISIGFVGILLCVGIVSAQTGEKDLVTNHEPGLRAPIVDSYSGNLDSSSSPTWNRAYTSNTYDATCNLSMTDSSFDGQYYEVIAIQVTANEDLTCEVTSFASSDSTMTLFCDPFDPTQPMANVIAYDDDDGAGNLSAFVADDHVALSPGVTYYLVISGYDDTNVGAFTVDLTSATVAVVPVELQSFSIE